MIKGIQKLQRKIDELNQLNRRFSSIAGSQAVGFYKHGFRRKGYIDTRYERWKNRKDNKKGRGRAVLVKTGRLRRSIRIVRKGIGYVMIGTDVPYAKIHNEGGTITAKARVKSFYRKAHKKRVHGKTVKVPKRKVKDHTRQMNTTIPQRQFLGNSTLLRKRIIMHLRKDVRKILNK